MTRLIPTRNGRRGNAMLEFALCMSFLTPLLLGTFNIGMNLGRNLQVTQLSRNVGHMYVRWVDFSQTGSQDLAIRLAVGLNMARTSGDGIVVLSQVTVPSDADCTANNLTGAACVNRNVPVIIHRIVFGNATLPGSAFGTPAIALVQPDGTISPANYLTDTSVRATNWSSVMTLAAGEVAYVSEVYVRSPSWDLPGQYANSGVYARTIY
ncbi:MAG: hypothetical protein NTZ56_18720 [Acidobacteria bacterium]|nr:hypothetical protein [Acidobacteriota bacterium]